MSDVLVKADEAMITQAELVTLLRGLADSLEQRVLVEGSLKVSYGADRDLKEGPPKDDWKTWVPTGKRSVKISYTFKEVIKL
jgi:hypothetical protein